MMRVQGRSQLSNAEASYHGRNGTPRPFNLNSGLPEVQSASERGLSVVALGMVRTWHSVFYDYRMSPHRRPTPPGLYRRALAWISVTRTAGGHHGQAGMRTSTPIGTHYLGIGSAH